MVRICRLICAILVACLAAGCTTQQAAVVPGHQDPEIWRPINPTYPMP